MARGLRAFALVGHETDYQGATPNPFLVGGTPGVESELPFAEEGVSDPSRQSLLLRAAEHGGERLTWENLTLTPADPILGEKMKPRVVERRARFRKIVKAAVGVCIACCLVGAASSAVSSGPTSSAAASAVRKAVPASGTVTIEKLDMAVRGKAPARHANAAARFAPAAKFAKRR